MPANTLFNDQTAKRNPAACSAENKWPKRTLVLGSPGAGKTTFAKELHRITKRPLFHLDDLYWKRGWSRPTEQDFHNELVHVTDRDEWIIDGNYSASLDLRMRRTEQVILLDVHPAVCIFSVLKRAFSRYMGNRSSIPAQALTPNYTHNPRFSIRFAKLILGFRRIELPKIHATLRQFQGVATIQLRGRSHAKEWLRNVEKQQGRE